MLGHQAVETFIQLSLDQVTEASLSYAAIATGFRGTFYDAVNILFLCSVVFTFHFCMSLTFVFSPIACVLSSSFNALLFLTRPRSVGHSRCLSLSLVVLVKKESSFSPSLHHPPDGCCVNALYK